MSVRTELSTGVSFVVPLHNGDRYIVLALESILQQHDGRPFEVLVVDDHSRDNSRETVRQFAVGHPCVKLLDADARGAASAINTGFREAAFPVVCQVDQDVLLKPGWLRHLLDALEDDRVGAAQGYYETDRAGSLFAKTMGFDLEQRYRSIATGDTDHVCTGNAAYRAEALRRANYLDESMGYGYDNDLSYRLKGAGYQLKLVPAARSTHCWREDITGYFLQQYGFGYGRLDIVARHPSRVTGDAVSRAGMMAHPVLTLVALLALAGSLFVAVAGSTAAPLAGLGFSVLLALGLERAVCGVRAAIAFKDATPLIFPFAHLVRDLAWVAAILVWSGRRAFGRPSRPHHSMQPGARTINQPSPNRLAR